mmetsp:Transcript_26640/g.84781  ORF Transcript_26640/g.84781 Transcript_26640/m.84781 type:complete len:355 (-) Transcript_26640:192-1256(-)
MVAWRSLFCAIGVGVVAAAHGHNLRTEGDTPPPSAATTPRDSANATRPPQVVQDSEEAHALSSLPFQREARLLKRSRKATVRLVQMNENPMCQSIFDTLKKQSKTFSKCIQNPFNSPMLNQLKETCIEHDRDTCKLTQGCMWVASLWASYGSDSRLLEDGGALPAESGDDDDDDDDDADDDAVDEGDDIVVGGVPSNQAPTANNDKANEQQKCIPDPCFRINNGKCTIQHTGGRCVWYTKEQNRLERKLNHGGCYQSPCNNPIVNTERGCLASSNSAYQCIWCKGLGCQNAELKSKAQCSNIGRVDGRCSNCMGRKLGFTGKCPNKDCEADCCMSPFCDCITGRDNVDPELDIN